MEKLITVVVCTYNQQHLIGRTLDSILAQKCSWPFEIVIGEDHSTDDTLRVCQRYAEANPGVIRILAREKNMGLVDNYFDCLLSARGKYIADIAGDDEWCDPFKLQKELDIMELHDDVVLVHTDYQLRDEATGRLTPATPYPFRKGMASGSELVLNNFLQRERPLAHLCTSLYRKETFLECLAQYPQFFIGSGYPCEDLQLSTLFSTKGRFAYIDEVTLNYSINSASISNAPSYEKQWHFVEGAARLRYDLAVTLNLQNNNLIREKLSQMTYVLLMHAFRVCKPEFRDRTLALADKWGVTTNGIMLLLKVIMSSKILWKCALAVRKIVLVVKAHYK